MSNKTAHLSKRHDPSIIYKNLSLKNVKGERWRWIPGLEGYYMASTKGRVKCNIRTELMKKVFILQQMISNKGYLICTISVVGKKKRGIPAHRLIAMAFIPNPENKPCVNHRFGNKKDNRPSKLEWSTVQENTIHAYKTGLISIKSGEDSHNAKLRNKLVLAIFKSKGKTAEIAKQYKVHPNTVLDIKAGRSWGRITGKVNIRRWDVAYNTKITPKLVLKIFNAKRGSNKEIANRYGVSVCSVWRIKSGNAFSNLTNKSPI